MAELDAINFNINSRLALMKIRSKSLIVLLLSTLISTSIILSLSAVYATTAPVDVIRAFDLKQYHPENYGLKDLVFEARIKGLDKVLSDSKYLGKVHKVYFKVYWVFPGRSKIEIHGLASGFKKLRTELKTIIASRLWMVIPQKLMGQFRSFQLDQKVNSNGIVITGEDPTNLKQVNKIRLQFDNDNRLLEYKSFSPFGIQTTYLQMSDKSWSHNKLVTEKVKVVNQIGARQNVSETKLEYVVQGRVGLPQKLKITNWNEMDESRIKGAKEFNKKSRKSGATFELLFSKFEINTKKALQIVKETGSKK